LQSQKFWISIDRPKQSPSLDGVARKAYCVTKRRLSGGGLDECALSAILLV